MYDKMFKQRNVFYHNIKYVKDNATFTRFKTTDVPIFFLNKNCLLTKTYGPQITEKTCRNCTVYLPQFKENIVAVSKRTAVQ